MTNYQHPMWNSWQDGTSLFQKLPLPNCKSNPEQGCLPNLAVAYFLGRLKSISDSQIAGFSSDTEVSVWEAGPPFCSVATLFLGLCPCSPGIPCLPLSSPVKSYHSKSRKSARLSGPNCYTQYGCGLFPACPKNAERGCTLCAAWVKTNLGSNLPPPHPHAGLHASSLHALREGLGDCVSRGVMEMNDQG